MNDAIARAVKESLSSMELGDVAETIGVKYSTLSGYLNGHSPIPGWVVVAVAELSGSLHPLHVAAAIAGDACSADIEEAMRSAADAAKRLNDAIEHYNGGASHARNSECVPQLAPARLRPRARTLADASLDAPTCPGHALCIP